MERRARRMSTGTSIELSHGARRFAAAVWDVSKGGLKIRVNDGLVVTVGETYRFTTGLPTGPVEGEVEVMGWDADKCVANLRFVALDPTSRRNVDDYCDATF